MVFLSPQQFAQSTVMFPSRLLCFRACTFVILDHTILTYTCLVARYPIDIGLLCTYIVNVGTWNDNLSNLLIPGTCVRPLGPGMDVIAKHACRL